jgi:hypothetical protein
MVEEVFGIINYDPITIMPLRGVQYVRDSNHKIQIRSALFAIAIPLISGSQWHGGYFL